MTPPVVSVLMATYGARDWTQRALTAVAEHTEVPHEVIVVDNASPDGTADMIREEFPAVRLVANDRNTGYGAANNQAASLAAAPVLALLNSDALVPASWAGPLLAALERPGVGVVVPALVHLDGRLQTAGAVLGADGSVLALGNGADPDDPVYAFERTCDFGAGACLVVRRDDFLGAGGFDPVYDPAYFEDADLCMTLAAQGRRTVFVPSVRVAHRQFASSEGARDADAQFLRSRAPFLERWAGTLARDRVPAVLPEHAATTLAARDAPAAARLLVLCGGAFPDPSGRDGAALAALSDPGRDLRVTLVADGGDAAAWSARGAEALAEDAGALLAARAGHYDVVAGDVGPHAEALRAHQPQAFVTPDTGEAARFAGALAFTEAPRS